MNTKEIKVGQFTEISNRLEKHFDDRARTYDDGLKAVDWKSRNAQYNRFQQILKLIDASDPISILDYGCGDGELVKFLNVQNVEFEYFGFDVSLEMLERAKKAHAHMTNCHFVNDLRDLPTLDYVVASGVFAMKFDSSEADWKEYMVEQIKLFNDLATKGFAFNCLTSYSDIEFQRSDLYYADPLFWFDHCKRHVSRWVSLLHDYPEYDFTIIVRK